MIETINRPATRTHSARGGRQGSLLLAGTLSAIAAASLGLLACLLVVVLGWATDPNSTGTSPALVRAAAQLWLLAHRTPIHVDGQSVSLAPIGLTAVFVVLLVRAATSAAGRARARSRRDVLMAMLCIAPPYALLALVVAGAADTPGLRPLPGHAFVAALTIAVGAACVAAVRRVGWHAMTAGMPAPFRLVPVAALAATATLVATGAVLVAAVLIVEAPQVTSIAGSIQGRGPAGFALVVVQVLLAPNAAVWGAAYAARTGFAVGVGTAIAPSGVVVGAVPGLPMLAALPAAGPAPAAAAASLVGVLLAGVVAGVLVGSRLDSARRHLAAPLAIAAVVCAAGMFGGLCWFAGGSGPGRLAPLGPPPLLSAAAAIGWMVLTAAPAAWLASWNTGRHDPHTGLAPSTSDGMPPSQPRGNLPPT